MQFVELEISVPENHEMITALDLATGAPIPPITRLETMDSNTWENFTLELVHQWKIDFKKVTRCGGGGDMGRDVIAYTDQKWENFQCKFYAKRLSVAEAILEVGKLIYYSFIGEYSLPTKYYFVSPKGNSTDLIKVLCDVTGEKLKKELFVRWDKACKDEISKKISIHMSDDLREYINTKVDFRIFDDIPPLKLIELHRKTPYHAIRFGAYHKKRDKLVGAPTVIDWGHEQKYVQALLDVFSEKESKEIDSTSLASFKNYQQEFDSARNNFYAAHALDKFSRDWLPANCFTELKSECYEVVSATISMQFADGYTRYLHTSQVAATAAYDSHPLNQYMKIQDKKGLCHHLIHDLKIRWIPE